MRRWTGLGFIGAFLIGTMVWSAQHQRKLSPQKPPPSEKPIAQAAVMTGVHDPDFRYIEGRDPFENVTIPRPRGQRPREIRSVADLLVEEVQVLGIFQNMSTKRYYALVRGSGLKRAETITVGQKLYNGEVMQIGPYTDEDTGERKLCVVFRVETDDPFRPYIRVVRCTTSL